eukprot:g5547.t1
MISQLLVLCFCFSSSKSENDILQSSKSIEQWIIKIRRELHQIPELEFDLPKTSRVILNILDQLNISYKYPVARSGIVAEIGTGAPVVGLRADMDALPIQETTGLVFSSKHDGRMHACGHDAHTAMLLGAARLLKEQEGTLRGKVRLLFQPAEEISSGAKAMIQEGAVDDLSVIFGLHVYPGLRTGNIAIKAGVMNAAMNFFEVTVTGRGGHGAMPSGVIDPFIPVANMILAYQTVISRTMDPREAHVISITKINGGHAFNVIPDSISFSGTMRSLVPGGIERITAKFIELTNRIAGSYNCQAEVVIKLSCIENINDAEATEFAKQVGRKLIGKDQVLEAIASSGSEDFAFYGQKIPTVMIALGTKNEIVGSDVSLHNANFKLDEEVLHIGTALHTSLALDYLNKYGTISNDKTEL